MTELKLDSSLIDPIQLRTYESIARVTLQRQIPFIIIGASARDLVMHHCYGAPIQRATKDIDLAVQVSDWGSFESICASLVAEGYKKTSIRHRLLDIHGLPLDIIPFGPLEDPGSKISWPPRGEVEMGVMGFQEALENSDMVIVDGAPELKLPVASPQGLALLKLIAWFERDGQTRRKDAADLAYLAANYENIPGMMEQLFEQHSATLGGYGWDTRLTGAHVLGLEVAKIANSSTMAFFKSALNADQVADLERDGGTSRADGGTGVITAFHSGLFNN